MEEFKGPRLFLYNLSSTGHAIFERIFVVYTLIFFLPPDEYTKFIGYNMKIFLPENLIFGLIPVFGIILILGRAVDAIIWRYSPCSKYCFNIFPTISTWKHNECILSCICLRFVLFLLHCLCCPLYCSYSGN